MVTDSAMYCSVDDGCNRMGVICGHFTLAILLWRRYCGYPLAKSGRTDPQGGIKLYLCSDHTLFWYLYLDTWIDRISWMTFCLNLKPGGKNRQWPETLRPCGYGETGGPIIAA
jgi:hypothetical protein